MAAVLAGSSPVLRGYSNASRRHRASFDQPNVLDVDVRPGAAKRFGTTPRLRRTSLAPRRLVQASGTRANVPVGSERVSRSRRRVLDAD